ncbi:MAG: hypothetical protein ACYSRZ_03865 [Planctomycetota bacterium]
MSTLTKILIVLLTISSFFLCGIVVTYVANADNYKKLYSDLRSEKDALAVQATSLKTQLNEQTAKTQQLEDSLKAQISSLRAENATLGNELGSSEREKSALLQKVNSWASITKDFYKTNDQQGLLLKNTLQELNKAQAAQIKDRKKLNETSALLVEKMAIIDLLNAEKRRLVEEKTKLQAGLDKMLVPTGEAFIGTVPAGQQRTVSRPSVRAEGDMVLQGLISNVDLKNSMAEISLGSADGVKDGMKFHVTRGEEFVCDVLIVDIDTDKSVGVLDLVQKQPKVGDNVTTSL